MGQNVTGDLARRIVLIVSGVILVFGTGFYTARQIARPENQRQASPAESGTTRPAAVDRDSTTVKGGKHMAAALNGSQEFSGVSALNLSVRNGTIDCAQADLPAGTVSIAWEYGGRDIDRADRRAFELRLNQAGASLKVEDWQKPGRNPLSDLETKLTLTLRHGPDVEILDISHGNGTLHYTGSAHGDFSLGNGTMVLAGQPAGDLAVNLGNGKVNARWLLTGGACDVNVGNGSAQVELENGSGITLDSTVGIGGITAPGGIQVERSQMLGAQAQGCLGDGAARMDISIGNGSIRLEQV